MWFWLVMAVAGLIVEGMFRASGLVPATGRSQIVTSHFEWNYTTISTSSSSVVFGAAVLGSTAIGTDSAAGRGYAIDPVCGMQVQTANAPAQPHRDGHTYWFCSDRCRDRFQGRVSDARTGGG